MKLDKMVSSEHFRAIIQQHVCSKITVVFVLVRFDAGSICPLICMTKAFYYTLNPKRHLCSLEYADVLVTNDLALTA